MNIAAVRLRRAMRKAGHTVCRLDRSGAGTLRCFVALCDICGASYRVWDGEPVPHIWPCSLHRSRNGHVA